MTNELEPVDEQFNTWMNRSQPLKQIISVVGPLPRNVVRNIKTQLKAAWVQGFGEGAAHQSARERVE